MALLIFYNFGMFCNFVIHFMDEQYYTDNINSNKTYLENYGIDPNSGFPSLYMCWLLMLSLIKINDIIRKNYLLSFFSFSINFIYKINVKDMKIMSNMSTFNQMDLYISAVLCFISLFHVSCKIILSQREKKENNNIDYNLI